MTAFEIVSTIISFTSVLIGFGMFVVALLNFLDKRNNKQK